MTLTRYETRWGHGYRLDGKAVTGVTTLINKGLPKPALPPWAAREAATYAADNFDALASLDRDGRIAAIKQAPWSQRDKAAARGTEVHALAEALVHGEEVEIPEHVVGHVEGYVKWLDASGIEPVLTEKACASRKWWYAGTFDVVFDLNGERWLADWKTSRGVYGESAMQTAAYAGAEFYLDDDGAEVLMPDVDRLGVVHIREDGTDLFPVMDRAAAWKDWLHVAWVGKAESRIKGYLGDPVQFPERAA